MYLLFLDETTCRVEPENDSLLMKAGYARTELLFQGSVLVCMIALIFYISIRPAGLGGPSFI